MSNDNKPSSDMGFLWFAIGIVVLAVMFSGEPDVGDAIRIKALKWAGIHPTLEENE